MIELSQLEHLAALAQYGTLSRAAEALNTSQPVLSRTMQKLEEELQVSLFDRRKNRLTLNPNGEVAVQCAQKVLEEARRMVEQVRAFDRSRRTILIGSCAPAPLWNLLSLVTQFFPDMTISSEMKDGTVLLDGLRDGVRLKDIDGERMLLHADIGFWREWSQRMLPSTYFLLQHNFEDFDELVSSSVLPAFSSDVMMRSHPREEHRIQIPILDPEAHVTYYCLCRAEDRQPLAPVFREITVRGL